jgi:hypothetical protein
MRAPVEIYFTGGQNKQTGQELLLSAGESKVLRNADLSLDGVLSPGQAFNVAHSYASPIHSLLGYPGGTIWVGEGENLKVYNQTFNILTGLAGTKIQGSDYNGWMYVANGTDKKKFLIGTTKYFEWGVVNPVVAAATASFGGDAVAPAAGPTVAAGAAGNPNGTYDCYFSYVVRYSDNSEFETTLSPATSVIVTNDIVDWTNIPASTNPLVTHKRLYRDLGGVKYLVAEITNATLTYSDDLSDVDLAANDIYYYTADPVVAPSMRIGAAACNLNGTYQCYYTYVIKVGGVDEYETNLSPVKEYDVDGIEIIWTMIPSSVDAAVTHKNLYRLVSGEIHLVAQITNATGTFTDNVADSVLEAADVYGSYPGDGGLPKGRYPCYFSYVAKYSDGTIYETNLGPVSDVTVANKKIVWSSIPVSSDPQVTHKRLYRSVSGITRFVVEIENAETFYLDNISDEDLLSAASFERDEYYPPPAEIWDVTEHYRRLFVLVDGDYSNHMFWSEPEEPQAFLMNALTGLYRNSTDVFRKGDPCMGMAVFGGDMFIASRSTFKRLVGSNPSYWALRPTMTTKGNVARYAMKVLPIGIAHVWFDGLYIFNGFTSSRITLKNDPFFKNIDWEADADSVESVFDGKLFRLFIADKILVVDLSKYPRIKSYEEDSGETQGLFDERRNNVWFAKEQDLGRKSAIDPVDFEVWSKTFPTDRLLQISGAALLNYELDTGGQDLTLTIYHDGVAHPQPITLNTQVRTRQTQTLPIKNATTIAIKLSGNVSNAVKIYEPWILGAELGRS